MLAFPEGSADHIAIQIKGQAGKFLKRLDEIARRGKLEDPAARKAFAEECKKHKLRTADWFDKKDVRRANSEARRAAKRARLLEKIAREKRERRRQKQREKKQQKKQRKRSKGKNEKIMQRRVGSPLVRLEKRAEKKAMP
jgi:hypothetical protein